MTKASLTLNVKKGVTVVRDGKRVRPQIGKDFEFTAEERDNILKADPGALVKATGETGEAEEGTSFSAEQSQSKATGGRKKSTANKSDADNKADGDGNAPDTTTEKKPGEGESSTADETAGDDDL